MEYKIPKTIHYCWLGGNPETELMKKCLDSWKRYLPEYEIIRWDESNFNLNENRFAYEAYQQKKWAFVSDYLRLSVLCNYGGIYMDTDVEVLKNFEVFLQHGVFSGFETESLIPTGIMAAQKGHPLVKRLLDYYEDRPFVLENGKFDTKTNVLIITEICQALYGLVPNGKTQTIADDVYFYSKEYFCPKEYKTGNINITSNTYCIHHFAGSWIPWQERLKVKLIRTFIETFGEENYDCIKKYLK